MADHIRLGSAGVREAVRDFRAAPPILIARVRGTTRRHGNALLRRVRANASGRTGVTFTPPDGGPPGEIGPRVQTGDYRRSIRLEHGDNDGDPYSEVGTSHPAGRRLEQGFIGADALGRNYCVDEETEALTQRGWKRWHELRPSDELLALDPTFWQARWEPHTALNVFPGPHPVKRMAARTLDICTTPDHRWLVEAYRTRKRQWVIDWRTTADMPKNARIPTAAKVLLPAVATVDDDVVELAAWTWTEGCIQKSKLSGRPIGVRLSQSTTVNPDKAARISRLLLRMFGPEGSLRAGHHWHVNVRPNGVAVYSLDSVSVWLLRDVLELDGDKTLRPEWLCRLTQQQLDLLIEVSLEADGHTDAAGVTKLGQASESRIRSWEMACVLAGHAVVTRAHQPGWVTTLLRSSFSHGFGSALRVDRDHASIVDDVIDGPVWCPTTPSGTWLARRNGTVYFTGNSQPPYPHYAPGLEATAGEYATDLEKDYDVVDKILGRG